jgi:cyclic pyranopterin phosphate synthase
LPKIASADKIIYHTDKLQAYLRGERVFPATLELDITSACNRDCPDCPSTRSPSSHELSTAFVGRLFSLLEGQTRGLLLTGGEPTLAASFPKVLEMARQHSFQDIAVVTNGARLDDDVVATALLAHATTVRVSAYGWGSKSCEALLPTLQRVTNLRSRIEQERSRLEIGVSALTSSENLDTLEEVVDAVAAAGAHWIYFHPTCTHWHSGSPAQVDQTGVLTKIRELQAVHADALGVFVLEDRFKPMPLRFSGYHAAHFMLVVGADGKNYLAPEVKYHPQHVLADLRTNLAEDFLWHQSRHERIMKVSSSSYPALRSRHRGVLYNDLIQTLIDAGVDVPPQPADAIVYPHIL